MSTHTAVFGKCESQRGKISLYCENWPVRRSLRYERLAAGVAQLVEKLTCNQQVIGSSPIASSDDKNLLLTFSRSSSFTQQSGIAGSFGNEIGAR
jgi:hypothetical protein